MTEPGKALLVIAERILNEASNVPVSYTHLDVYKRQHLDGLADTCDGVFSARSRDRMLEIMRDSRLGTHGGLALIFVVLAKILVLSELALRGEPILALSLIHI